MYVDNIVRISTRSARVDALTCSTTVGGRLSAAGAAVSALDWPDDPSCSGAGELLLSPRLVLEWDSEVGDGSPCSSNDDNTRQTLAVDCLPAAPGDNVPPVPLRERLTTSSTTCEDLDVMLLLIESRAIWSAIGSVRECLMPDGDDVATTTLNCLELELEENTDSAILSSENVERRGG